MKPFFFLLALPALALFAPPTARAALNPALIPADARWVVYADLNAARTSAIGKELLGLAEKAQFQSDDVKVGVDVQKLAATIGTVTAYGTNFSKDPKDIDGTLIAQGTPDLRKIAESLLLQATLAAPARFAEVKDLPFPAYAIKPPPAKNGAQTEVIVAFPPEPIILVSKSRAQLLRARDVFNGKAASVAKAADSPLARLLKNSAGAFLFGASTVPSEQFFPADGPQARILQMASSGCIALGEDNAQTFAHAELVAASDVMADKLMKILQGMTAMMSLAETNDKQLAEFLNSASVTRTGDTVTLHVAYASARLAQMAQKLRQSERSAERPAGRPAPSIVSGKAVAEWTAVASADKDGPAATALAWRTIENVPLVNGSTVTLGRNANGGRPVRFDRVEIAPAAGGSPLIFKSDFMRTAGQRGSMAQFQFPGADGTYTLKVAYVNDPDGKATYAVSVRDPRAAAAVPPAPQPKSE